MIQRVLRPVLLVAALVLAASCAPREQAATNPDAAFERWTLGSPTVRIGGIDASRGAQLTSIHQVIPTRGDSVLITDSEIVGALYFDERGQLVRQIGRQGQGPGEFVITRQAGLLGDTIWVFGSPRRIAYLFGHDGNVLGARPFVVQSVTMPDGGMTSAFPRGLMQGGRMVSYLPINDAPPGKPSPPPHGAIGILAYFDTLGTAQDTLAWLVRGSRLLMMSIGTSIFFPGPDHFEDSPIWAVAGDGSSVVVVDRAVAADSGAPRYHVRRWNSRGELDLSVDVRYAPVPVLPSSTRSLTTTPPT